MEPHKKYPMNTSTSWTQPWPSEQHIFGLMDDVHLEMLIQDMMCEGIDSSDAKTMLENIGIKCDD